MGIFWGSGEKSIEHIGGIPHEINSLSKILQEIDAARSSNLHNAFKASECAQLVSTEKEEEIDVWAFLSKNIMPLLKNIDPELASKLVESHIFVAINRFESVGNIRTTLPQLRALADEYGVALPSDEELEMIALSAVSPDKFREKLKMFKTVKAQAHAMRGIPSDKPLQGQNLLPLPEDLAAINTTDDVRKSVLFALGFKYGDERDCLYW